MKPFLITTTILISLRVFGQNCIDGKILDENRNAIGFSTVLLENGAGAVTDSSGFFSICAASFDFPLKLTVRAVDYVEKEILVNSAWIEVEITLRKKVYELESINISSTQALQSKSNVSVLLISKDEIEKRMPLHVGELLENKAGFTQKSGYQTPITLRGLSGKRMLVLRDGNRRFSSYPAGFMSHTINIYDLERIEVEKGPASVSYGAGAIAGIINLVDKFPFKQKGFNAKITTGYGTNNNEKNILACGGWSNCKFSLKTGMRYRTADNFKYPDGSIAKNSFYTDKDLFVTAGYRPSDNQSLIFTADIHNGGPWGKPQGFSGTDYLFATTTVENNTNLSMVYLIQGKGFFDMLKLSTFYSKNRRELDKKYYSVAGNMLTFNEITRFSDFYYGAKVISSLRVFKNTNIRFGSELYSFHISTPVDAVDYIEELEYSNRVSADAHSYTLGFFAETEYLFSKTITLLGGIRSDFAQVFEGEAYSYEQDEQRISGASNISGNLSLKLKLESFNLKLNYSRAFRMPETTEMFTDNYTSNGILYGNPDLKPEHSNSFDLCMGLETIRFNVEVSPFLWLMDDMISKKEIKGQPGTNYQFVNIGRSRLWGGEITVSAPFRNIIKPNDLLNISASAAYLNGEDLTGMNNFWGNGVPFDFIPPLNFKSEIAYNCTYKNSIGFDISVRPVYYSKQNRVPEDGFSTPAYLILGTSAGIVFKRLKTKPSVRILANNLLNSEYCTYQSYLLSEGRTLKFFLTLNLN